MTLLACRPVPAALLSVAGAALWSITLAAQSAPGPDPAAPPRDPSARPAAVVAGTGVVRGRVVSADTGLPLRRAKVSLRDGHEPHGRSVTTDAADRTTHTLRYVLTTYRVDTPLLTIEPISARYYQRRPGQRLQDMAPAGEVQIPGAAVSFRSTIPENQPTYALRDGRESASRHALFVRAGSIGMALVVIALAPAVFLAAVAVRRRAAGRVGRRTARQSRADHRAALERLRSLDVTTDEDRRRAYDAISSAVREHIASRAGVPATALTATEIEDALAHARGRISREEVSALIASCDEARYGPPQAVPTPQACRDALSAAEQVLAH